MDRYWSRIAAVFGFLGVALGAFGAHGLRVQLEITGGRDIWEKAVLYHLVHTVVLLAVSWRHPSPPRVVCWAMTVGIVFFCGALYAYSVSGVSMWAQFAPIGGVAFLVGWGALAVSAKSNG
jgi:uncharacterized membrane protein YgdD (TMEM256/DUF423 family)